MSKIMLRRPPQKERQEAKDSFRFFRVGACRLHRGQANTILNIDDDDDDDERSTAYK